MFRRLISLAPYALAVLAAAARLLPTPRTIDDAFITFRYARNLLHGSGFVYNPGEHVLGTTTPLYTLLLAGLSGLTGSENYPLLALLVNAAADAAACLVLIRLGHALTGQRRVGLSAALLWAIAPMSVTFAIGGMETSVFILLLSATALLYVRQQARAAAVTAGLLLLTRPDGLLFVAPLMLDALASAWRQRRLPLAEAGLFLATVAPWALFATLYFGSPVPHSIAAKSLAYRLPPEAALVRLLQHYSVPFFESDVFGRFWPLAGMMLYFSLSAIGSLAALRRTARAWPLVMYPWLYLAVFAAANPLIFRWYLAPPLPFYFLFILAGVDRLLTDLYAAWARALGQPAVRAVPAAAGPPASAHAAFAATLGARPAAPAPRGLAAAAPGEAIAAPPLLVLPLAAFVALSLNAWSVRPDHGPRYPAPDMAWHLLELHYTAIGQSLAAQVTPDTVVAAGDVGALGYYSGARILDTVGLISPEATAYYPLDPALYVINYAVAPDLIIDRAPDYVVILEIYGRQGLLKDERFWSAYELHDRLDTDIYGSDGLLVLKRSAP